MYCVNELCYILFQFSIFLCSYILKITLKQRLPQNLKLIFKFSSIKRQINIPLWTHMEHEGWKKDRKTMIRCYTIAFKFSDEFDTNFVWLYFSQYRSINIWQLYLKTVEKSKQKYLRLLLTYPHQNLFNIKKYLALVLIKICPCSFLCIPN